MRKLKNILVISLILCLLSFSAASAKFSNFAGIHKSVPFFITMSFDGANKEILNKAVDTLTGLPNFSGICDDIAKKSGALINKEFLNELKNIESFSMSVFVNLENTSSSPNVFMSAAFSDEKTAGAVLENLKKSMQAAYKINYSKELTLTPEDNDGLQVLTPYCGKERADFGTLTPLLTKNSKTIGLFVYQKNNEQKSANCLKLVSSAFKDAKENISSNDNFKECLAKVKADDLMLIFFDGPLYKSGAIETNRSDKSDLVKYMVFSGRLQPDLSKMNFSGLMALKGVKDKNFAKDVETAKKFFSSGKNGITFSEIIPKEAVMFVNFNVNPGKYILNAPAAGRPEVPVEGVNFENDVLEAMDGNIMAAVFEKMSDFFVAFSVKDPKKAAFIFDKVQGIIKNVSPDTAIKTEVIEGVSVVTIAPKTELMSLFNVGDLKMAMGAFSNYFVIAANTEVFKKIILTSKDAANGVYSLAEFKTVNIGSSDAFANVYLNINKLDSLFSTVPNFTVKMSDFKLLSCFDQISASAWLKSDDLVFEAALTTAPLKIIGGMLSLFSDSIQFRDFIEKIK